MTFLLAIFLTAVSATRVCSPELPTCADVCNDEKWIKKLDICVEKGLEENRRDNSCDKAERLHTFCLVRTCNMTVSMDDIKHAGYKFLADIVGAYSRVQNIKRLSNEEDDIQDSELKCAERCADIKEDILGRCPCYKSEETTIEEKISYEQMRSMIYNLTEALDSVELKNEELQKKLETLESTVEQKAHRCKTWDHSTYDGGSFSSYEVPHFTYTDC